MLWGRLLRSCFWCMGCGRFEGWPALGEGKVMSCCLMGVPSVQMPLEQTTCTRLCVFPRWYSSPMNLWLGEHGLIIKMCWFESAGLSEKTSSSFSSEPRSRTCIYIRFVFFTTECVWLFASSARRQRPRLQDPHKLHKLRKLHQPKQKSFLPSFMLLMA